MSNDIRELGQRLERLERENRRLKRLGVFAGSAVGLLALAGAAAPLCEVLSAERLVLRDESGRSRVTIDAYRTEQPALSFQDRSGRTLAKLGVDKNGDAFLATYDAKGATRGNWTFAPEAPRTMGAPNGSEKKPESSVAED